MKRNLVLWGIMGFLILTRTHSAQVGFHDIFAVPFGSGIEEVGLTLSKNIALSVVKRENLKIDKGVNALPTDMFSTFLKRDEFDSRFRMIKVGPLDYEGINSIENYYLFFDGKYFGRYSRGKIQDYERYLRKLYSRFGAEDDTEDQTVWREFGVPDVRVRHLWQVDDEIHLLKKDDFLDYIVLHRKSLDIIGAERERVLNSPVAETDPSFPFAPGFDTPKK